MTETEETEGKISIKVLVDKEKNKVVYAEADYTFVDILFSFVTLPLGAIIRILGKNNDKKFDGFGNLNILYKSLMDLPVRYMSTEEGKFMLLNPKGLSYYYSRKLKINIDDTDSPKRYICEDWECTRCYLKFSTYNMTKCRHCGKLMNREVRFKDSSNRINDNFNDNGVFVRDSETFFVTDDLCVMPYSFGSCIQLLKNQGYTETSHLEERTVNFCREQILDLLKLALVYDSPLTLLLLDKNHNLLDSIPSGIFDKFDRFSEIKTKVYSSSEISVKVNVQKSTGKVMFAEADEEFLDFLFGFLAIPLGTLVGELIKGNSSMVCMENICTSISDMSTKAKLKSFGTKKILLGPHFGLPFISEKSQIFPLQEADFPPVYLHTIGKCFLTFSPFSPNWEFEAESANQCDPRIDEQLFKPSGMFMVTDDLVITPLRSIMKTEFLNNLKVSFDDIECHDVSIGLEEA